MPLLRSWGRFSGKVSGSETPGKSSVVFCTSLYGSDIKPVARAQVTLSETDVRGSSNWVTPTMRSLVRFFTRGRWKKTLISSSVPAMPARSVVFFWLKSVSVFNDQPVET